MSLSPPKGLRRTDGRYPGLVENVASAPGLVDNRRSTLTLGGERGIEGGAHGCRIGADGRRYLTRHGRPAGRAALAGRRGRALFAGKYEAIPFVGAQLLGVAVCGARHSVRAAVHREHAPRA